jgi:nitroreductase
MDTPKLFLQLGEKDRVRKCNFLSLLDLILTRRSIRKYEDKDIPEEVLEQILETGRQAPSAVNRQPIHFVVVNDLNILKNLCDNLIARFVKRAPLAIVGCANTKSLLTGKWAVIDATIAMQNMVIAALTFGIGSCWIGACNEKKIKELLKIPDKLKVVAVLTFGYPAEQPKQRKKKPFEEMFSFNSY